MLCGALAEMATIGAIVPFLGILADPESINRYVNFVDISKFFGISHDNFLLVATLFFCLVTIISGLVRFVVSFVGYRLSASISNDINVKVYHQTLNRPYIWHISRNSSEIITSIEKVNVVLGGIIAPIMQGSIALILAIGILSMLLIIDYATALIALFGFGLLYGLTTLTFRRRLLNNSKIMATNMNNRVKSVQEGLGGIRDVLISNSQDIYIKRFSISDYAVRKAQSTVQLIGVLPRYIIESLGMILIVIFAYWLTEKKGLDVAIPILGALAIGGQKLLPQMQLVYASLSAVIGSQKPLQDILQLLDELKTGKYLGYNDKSTPKTKKLKFNEPLIKLINISFSYQENSDKVLNNINLEIKRGERVGFVGKTGSGKSTLIDVMLGLLEINEGLIKVDGKKLCHSNLNKWQKRIAHVPQSIFLLDTSIAENVAFGETYKNIDIDRVKYVLDQVQLIDFVNTLPNKLDAHIGERGIKVSGGQRQRIGLARALYKKADLLVLDEATSALDTKTEKIIMDNIQEIDKNLTILMIAHRVSTLRKCDKIVELDKSRISRIGNYMDLVKNDKKI